MAIYLSGWKRSRNKIWCVENKGKRPYLVISKSVSQNHFLAIPLTDKFDISNNPKSKSKRWIEVLFIKESYLKVDQLILFDNKDLKHISLANKFATRLEIKQINTILWKVIHKW